MDTIIVKDVAAFIAALEGVMDNYNYKADNVINYDETQVFVANEGGIAVKKAGKEQAQRTGVKGWVSPEFCRCKRQSLDVGLDLWAGQPK